MSAAAASFTIKIKTVKGLTFDVTVTGQTTVEELKQKINTTRHIECSTQRLIYRGRILTSTQTMRDCQVTDGSTLHLIIRKNPANQANDTDTNNAANAANNGASAPPAAAAELLILRLIFNGRFFCELPADALVISSTLRCMISASNSSSLRPCCKIFADIG
mmetsp:Transcript_42707/g.70456  ORF Transcript_42707/g.70456 Transcript_42707/m.70456 type:complete len:162 (-) Transcript_42707:507-992(-)